MAGPPSFLKYAACYQELVCAFSRRRRLSSLGWGLPVRLWPAARLEQNCARDLDALLLWLKVHSLKKFLATHVLSALSVRVCVCVYSSVGLVGFGRHGLLIDEGAATVEHRGESLTLKRQSQSQKPTYLGKIPILDHFDQYNISQMGWKHQLVKIFGEKLQWLVARFTFLRKYCAELCRYVWMRLILTFKLRG